MNNELKNIALEQLAETQPEEISVKVTSAADRMLLKTAQLIIDSDLTEGQKMLRIYDTFESLVQEYNGAIETYQVFCDKHNIDSKTLSGNINSRQSKKCECMGHYIENIRKIAEPIGDYMYKLLNVYDTSDSASELKPSYLHYKKLNFWEAYNRSSFIRKLKNMMRGFIFKRKKYDYHPEGERL